MNNLVAVFKNSEEFKRLEELRAYFKRNKELDLAYTELKKVQKQLVKAKVKNDIILVSNLQKNYDKIKEGMLEMPFVSEYFELLEEIYADLKIVTKEIEKSFAKDFKL